MSNFQLEIIRHTKKQEILTRKKSTLWCHMDPDAGFSRQKLQSSSYSYVREIKRKYTQWIKGIYVKNVSTIRESQQKNGSCKEESSGISRVENYKNWVFVFLFLTYFTLYDRL